MDARELAKRALEREWQRANAVQTFCTAGASMGARLPPGSSVVVRFSQRPPLRTGMLIYLRRGDRRVVHRLVLRLGPVCVEKGDANRFPRCCWTRDVLGIVEHWAGPAGGMDEMGRMDEVGRVD